MIVEIREKALVAIRFLHHAALTGFAAILPLMVLGILPVKANEPVQVKVGAYEYSDIFFYDNDQPNGVVPKLIKLLNDFQENYEFRLAETSSRRRYEGLMNGDFDLVLFDSPKWEWHELDVQFSDTLLVESDLYVALASGEDPEALFSDVLSYPILCVLGFHYSFADFNADPAFLEANYDVLLRYNEEDVFDGLLAGEAPVGVISAGFLTTKLNQQPELSEKLVFAVMPHARYDLVSVLSSNSAITLEQFNQLIAKVKDSGVADHLWQHHHPDLPG